MKNQLMNFIMLLQNVFCMATLFLVAFPAMGQVNQKAFLTRDDYKMWHKIENPKISTKGNWASFMITYESGMDTLTVMNMRTNNKMFFPKASNGSFFEEEKFLYLDGETLGIVELNTGKINKQLGISQFRILEKQGYLALLEKSKDSYKLILRSLKGMHSLLEVDNVNNWLFNPANDMLALQINEGQTSAIKIVELFEKVTDRTIARTERTKFDNLIWQTDGKRLGFRTMDNETTAAIHVYNCLLGTTDSLTSEQLPQPQQFSNHSIYLEKASQYVFIGTAISRQQPDPNDVQIWNTADSQLFPQIAKIGVRPKQTVLRWSPSDGKLVNVMPNGFSRVLLNASGEYALLFDNSKDRSFSTREPAEDVYLHKIGTSQTTLMLCQFPGNPNRITASPEGRFFTFFNDGDWQVIECATGKVKNLTKGLQHTLIDEEGSYSGPKFSYDRALWTKGDKSLLVADAFDIYEITFNDGKSKRLTHGREYNIRFRLDVTDLDQIAYFAQNGRPVDTSLPLLLTATAPFMEKSGYYSLTKGKQEQKIYYEDLSVANIKKARDLNRYLIVEEDFHIAPRLKLIDKKGGNKIIYASNKQQQEFYWGRAERIWFTNSMGKKLPATLCYPAGYDPAKKYPMITRIYQRQAGSLHRYFEPALGVQAGINTGNMTTKGYFVLIPDIVYETGSPGKSALDCTLSAVDAAIAYASVDSSKIGLIGHSFGGYESAFIATQTNRFATIVIGSGATDLVTNYLKVSENGAAPDFWRFESDQYRMKTGLYEAFSTYLENSPIYYAEAIETPLLTYSGADDGQVSPLQSIELWLANLKLNKKHLMLLYPNEEHVFRTKKNKEDLCMKIEQWFDHYLKGDKYPDWAQPEQYRF
nr:prolyl oligopeptidase family serine peptidase [Flavobacterium sp. ASV13]